MLAHKEPHHASSAEAEMALRELLLLQVAGNNEKQLSIINGFDNEMLVGMPGLEYDQILDFQETRHKREADNSVRRL